MKLAIMCHLTTCRSLKKPQPRKAQALLNVENVLEASLQNVLM